MTKSAATIDHGKEAWQTYVTQRTKAVPKHSLFGSTLENVEKDSTRHIDVKAYETETLAQRQEKAAQYDYKLPSRLQNRNGLFNIILQYNLLLPSFLSHILEYFYKIQVK